MLEGRWFPSPGGWVAPEALLQPGMSLPWKNLPPLLVKTQLRSRNPKTSSLQWEMLRWGTLGFALEWSRARAIVMDAQVI